MEEIVLTTKRRGPSSRRSPLLFLKELNLKCVVLTDTV
nr:MAG TPA: hypothetical protein [Caudoviricetes sp.]